MAKNIGEGATKRSVTVDHDIPDLPRWVAGACFLAVAAIIILPRLVALIDVHDPAVDEAMLLANVPLHSVANSFQPLPLFNQATPLGHLLIVDLLAKFVPEHLVLLARLASVLASLIGALALYLAVRPIVSGPATTIALLLAAGTPFMLQYSLEIKHYVFEFMSCCLLLYAGLRLAEKVSPLRMAVFGIAGLITILFSFTAPLLIGATAVGVSLHHLSHGRSALRDRQLVHLFLEFAILVLACLVVYIVYTRPMTRAQFSGYAHDYEPALLTILPRNIEDIQSWYRPLGFFASQINILPNKMITLISLEVWTMISSSILLIGVVVTIRWYNTITIGYITLMTMIYALSVLGFLPIIHQRHFIFAIPFGAFLLSVGVMTVITAAARLPGDQVRWVFAPVSVSVLFLFVALVALMNVRKLDYLEEEQVSVLIERIRASQHASVPVWVYHLAQPAMRVLAPADLQQVGLVPHVTTSAAWNAAHRDQPGGRANAAYLRRFEHTISQHRELWLLFSHYQADHDLQRFRDVAEEAIGTCQTVLKPTGSQLWYCADATGREGQGDG